MALGVDEGSNRLVVITDEPTPRHAAMMQVDLAATLTDTRVSVARVIPFDLKSVAHQMIAQFGGLGAAMKVIMTAQEKAKEEGRLSNLDINSQISAFQLLGDHIELIKRVPFGKVNAFLQFVEQLKLIEIVGAIEGLKGETDSDATAFFDRFSLERLAATDIIASDREVGVCPLLLPSFSETEIDILIKPTAVENAKELLRAKRIYQYFFPGLDDLALGFVDRGVSKRPVIAKMVTSAPAMGHPHGENEIVGPTRDVMEVIDALRERGLTVEGEIGVELGPDGVTRRASVKFKPSEGVTTKILNRVNVNVNVNADVTAGIAGTIAKTLS